MNKLNFKFLLLLGLILASDTYCQSKQNNLSKLETVEKFLSGFNDPAKIQESLALLADSYQFRNPMVQLNSKAEFITLAQKMGQILTGVNLIHASESGDWVATYYEFKSSIKGLESNLASEWFRVEGGLIQESYLIYDASEWRKVYDQMGK